DRGGPDADAGIVAAEGLDDGRLPIEADRAPRAADARGRLDRDRHPDRLAGGDAAQHAAGAVADEALRGELVAVHAATIGDAAEAGADLDALDGIDAHHGMGDVGIELVVQGL